MPRLPHLLIVGVGSIGERHLRCFKSTDRCTVAFCEPHHERRDDVSRRYQVTGYRDWQEAVSHENFSAAVIASPAPTHIPVARSLTDHGLDLLIEKPLSLSLEGVDQLTQLVEQNATRVAVGFMYRTLPALQRMRAALVAGEFGRMLQVQVNSGQHFPFYRPAYREIYYSDPVQGGGLIQDMLPHSLNAVEWIVGPATQVVVDAAHQVLAGVEVEDTVNLLTRHGEIMACFSVNQHQPVNETTLTVICERGAARFELIDQRWLSAKDIGGQWTERDSFVCERDDYYIMQANAFLDLCNGQAEPHCSLTDGISTLKSTIAIIQSRTSNSWVNVN